MKKSIILLPLVAALSMASCQNYGPGANSGAATGAVLGGLTGAIIGNQSHGKTGQGALIGAAAGGLIGGAYGNAQDQRRAGY